MVVSLRYLLSLLNLLNLLNLFNVLAPDHSTRSNQVTARGGQ